MVAWLAPIAGALLEGGFSAFGQSQANAANKKAAEAAMAFSADQAEKNRIFQLTMANTRYQRTMADMKKAGLNPILAYQQGGGPVPGGSAASGQSWQAGNVFGNMPVTKAAASAVAAYKASNEAKQIDAMVNNLRADTEKKWEEGRTEASKQNLNLRQAELAEKTANLHVEQADTSSAQRKRWQYQNIRDATETALSEVMKDLRKSQLPELQTRGEFYKSFVGKVAKSVERILASVTGGIFQPKQF